MPAGNAYSSGHIVPSPFLGLACDPIVETRFLELAFFSTFHLEYPLVLKFLHFVHDVFLFPQNCDMLLRNSIKFKTSKAC